MRPASAVLSTFVLIALFAFGSFESPAAAGDYRDAYYPRQRSNVWYSSDCCYKKIVRHIREVRYVRVAPPLRHNAPQHRYGYDGGYRPWRESVYRPYRAPYYSRPASVTDIYIGPPRRFEGYPPGYMGPRYGAYREDGYDAYAATVEVAPTCVWRRAPVIDGKGGWVWGFKRVCS